MGPEMSPEIERPARPVWDELYRPKPRTKTRTNSRTVRVRSVRLFVRVSSVYTHIVLSGPGRACFRLKRPYLMDKAHTYCPGFVRVCPIVRTQTIYTFSRAPVPIGYGSRIVWSKTSP